MDMPSAALSDRAGSIARSVSPTAFELDIPMSPVSQAQRTMLRCGKSEVNISKDIGERIRPIDADSPLCFGEAQISDPIVGFS